MCVCVCVCVEDSAWQWTPVRACRHGGPLGVGAGGGGKVGHECYGLDVGCGRVYVASGAGCGHVGKEEEESVLKPNT